LLRILTRIIEIFHRDFEYSEFQGSCIAIVWGVWLLIPSGESSLRMYFGQVQNLMILGVVAIIVGACQLTALISSGHVISRRTTSFYAVLYWLYSFGVAVVQNWRLMPTPLLLLFALAAAWAYWRLGRPVMMMTRDQILSKTNDH